MDNIIICGDVAGIKELITDGTVSVFVASSTARVSVEGTVPV